MLSETKKRRITKIVLGHPIVSRYVDQRFVDQIIAVIESEELKNFKCPVCREIMGPMTEQVAKGHPGAFMFYE